MSLGASVEARYLKKSVVRTGPEHLEWAFLDDYQRKRGEILYKIVLTSSLFSDKKWDKIR